MIPDPQLSYIQKHLEELYDIPFDVSVETDGKANWVTIRPGYDGKEYFQIRTRIKDKIRLIIEVKPEEYAAFTINDMGNATQNQKSTFVSYNKLLQEKKAKIFFSVNNVPVDILNDKMWPVEWKNFKFRMSRSPVFPETEKEDVTHIISEWTGIVCGMFLSLLNIIKIDDDNFEKKVKRVEVNRYERNPLNREICLEVNGYDCKICGFNFEKVYGEIGREFIHVHHIVPVSETGGELNIDPVKDLIPVCPNCHAMLHSTVPPLKPEKLKEILKRESERKD